MKKVSNKISFHLTIVVISIIAFSSCSRTQFRSIAEAPKVVFSEPPPDIPVDPVTPPIVPPPPVEPPPIIPPPPVEPPPIIPPPPVEPPPIIPPPPVEPPPIVPPPPVEPPPIIPPPPVEPPVQKSGACANDSTTQLLSCMNCVVPLNPPLPPQFSEKGKALIDIMTIGCSVPNKSAPKGYEPPTRAELITRLNRLSPVFYPDSTMTEGQKKVVQGLRTDPKLQQKMFGGLWYQPPYSDHLETYFGITTAEAVYALCYHETGYTPTSAQPLMSKQFMDCQYSGDPYSCREKPEYVKANGYRDQLNNAMKESIRNPYVAPPRTPAKKCNWENFEGDYDLGGEGVLARWLVAGFKAGMEIGNLGGKCEMVTSIPTGSNRPRGLVKMAGYICK